MHTTLHFHFPSPAKEVEVRIFIPSPEHRPQSVANFLFMCTGVPPQAEWLRRLGLSPTQLSTPLPPTLRPFADEAVVRIDKDVLLELGGSTTKTIFGGFTPDEPLPPVPSRGCLGAMQSLRAGTLLLGNMGTPDTNASRYYILLHDATEAMRREALSIYAPFGFLTGGLDALRAASAAVAVHPRTLTPLRPVRLKAAEVQCAPMQTPQNQTQPQSEESGGRKASGVQRISLAGRTRSRAEFEEEEDTETTLNTGGFFSLSRQFPTKGDAKKGKEEFGPERKRLRAEREVREADGTTRLRTTAVPPTDGEAFDFFAAQEAVFMNDIDGIAQTQAERQHHRQRRNGKVKAMRRTGGASKQKGNGNGEGSKHKVLRRRY